MSHVISCLAGRLRDAGSITSEIFSEVVRDACWRLPSVRRTKDFERLEQFIQTGAWTDAALTLLALETPQWRLRHIVHDGGEWHCSLSRVRELPDWLDQPVEAWHGDLCLAILSALVGVKRDETPTSGDGVANFSRMDHPLDLPLCCDNFT